jgi:hypothetical protein
LDYIAIDAHEENQNYVCLGYADETMSVWELSRFRDLWEQSPQFTQLKLERDLSGNTQ